MREYCALCSENSTSSRVAGGARARPGTILSEGAAVYAIGYFGALIGLDGRFDFNMCAMFGGVVVHFGKRTCRKVPCCERKSGAGLGLLDESVEGWFFISQEARRESFFGPLKKFYRISY